MISLAHLEDAGPTARWSSPDADLWEVLRVLGERQTQSDGAMSSRRDHYQRQPEKLIPSAFTWLAARPAMTGMEGYLWSFRISARHRVWGILIDGVFHLLWNDPDHTIFAVEAAVEVTAEA